jgi:choice-of-anchor B domain-containing protein
MKKTMERLAVGLLLLLWAAPGPVSGTPGSGPGSAAGYGATVAVGDGVVFVGEGANTFRPGMVYVYRPDGGGRWVQAQRLTAPSARPGDGFGLALTTGPGVLLVGQGDTDRAGGVHVFVADRPGQEWKWSAVLEPGDGAAGDGFGSALVVSGSLIAIGAPGAEGGAGRVYLFERSGDGWTQAATLTPAEPGQADGFGASVSLDGTRLLVGAPGRGGGGAAFVFRQDAGTGDWTQETELALAAAPRRAGFGSAIALFGGRALVAAPGYDGAAGAVFTYALDPVDGSWALETTLRPFDVERYARFGASVVATDEGAYVGAPGSGEAGAVYRIRRGESGWVEAEKLVSDRVAAGGGFGASLAVHGDLVVAGAAREDYGAGSAVILTRSGGAWRTSAKIASEAESLPSLTGAERRCDGGIIAGTFECAEVDLLSFLPVEAIGGGRGVNLNDIWGWTDPETGREYALVGRVDGTSFVDVTDPTAPAYLGDLPTTPGSTPADWRDIKVYADHALIVADGAGAHGMQVFDLTRLRDIPEPITFDADAVYDGVASSHNIVVDTASGFAFAVGASGGGETCGGGLHMIDVRDPKAPEFAGCFSDPQTGRASTGYSHDAQCVTYQGPDEEYRGREICFGANETALSIADVTDKERPVAVARATYPNVGYAHQGWLTPDQRYFFMNDELDELQGTASATRTLIWDVVELDDPQLVGEFMGTTEASDHNLYIRGTVMYQSNYAAGLRVVDISDPENPREVGYFDTVPYGTNAPGMDGSWSNYPFFPSGTIVVTSWQEGLFVLRLRRPIS